jgi:hypothetical protein
MRILQGGYPNCSDHALASSVRFHSRHNRLKGGRRDHGNFRTPEDGMLSRALSLATVMLVIGCFAADPVRAQNLEAGKTPAQIFAGSCTACHKGSRGLLRTVPPGSLPGFLRQHYTTSPDMAKMLSAYLISNGATDTRYRVETPKQQPGDLKPAPRSEPEQSERHSRKPSQEAARPPDADGTADEPHGRKNRHGKRLARPGTENPEAAKPASEGQPPKEAASEHEGRKHGAKQKLSKRGKHGKEEPPKADAKQESPKDEPVTKPETAKGEPGAETGKGETAKGEISKGENAKDDTSKVEAPKEQPAKEQAAKPDAVKPDVSKPDASKPEQAKSEGGKTETGKAETGKSETSKSETSKSETSKSENGKPDSGPAQAAIPSESKGVPLRADPVPAVTPAPKVGEGDAKPPSQAASPASTPAASEPAAAPSSQAETSAEPVKPATPAAKPDSPPSVASSTSPPAPTGPPVPPISK